ncbi:Seryl-tRNA synthetase [Nostoc flagelliforme CCNUN1]|uniref:Seryl-tRNA synthetase n=1 Tax=Nostoc flagelliforme CCNUN1 TaxID=2038116 RepID=A0A2K8T494_9NOSO|nr:Seryl-tRNA synthetase [Nostoc flagelliforme CCNUN1]
MGYFSSWKSLTILGDRLYGCCAVTSRLHLHPRNFASSIRSQKNPALNSITPF